MTYSTAPSALPSANQGPEPRQQRVWYVLRSSGSLTQVQIIFFIFVPRRKRSCVWLNAGPPRENKKQKHKSF